MLDTIMSALAPHYCVYCGAAGSLLCEPCVTVVDEPHIPSRCCMCHALTNESATCKKCLRRYSLPKNVWVHSQYDEEAKALVRLLKYGRARDAAHTIALLLDKTLPYLDSSDTVFVPAPTAPVRRRVRGFDHTLAIARELSKLRAIDCSPMLFRTSNTQQVGSSRKKRLSQLEGAFHHKDMNIPKSTKIVLVDDLMTTGGTLIAATKELKRTGYKSVYAAVFAQK